MTQEEKQLFKNMADKLDSIANTPPQPEPKYKWTSKDLYYSIPILIMLFTVVYSPWKSLRIDVDFNKKVTTEKIDVNDKRIQRIEEHVWDQFPDERNHLRDPRLNPYSVRGKSAIILPLYKNFYCKPFSHPYTNIYSPFSDYNINWKGI